MSRIGQFLSNPIKKYFENFLVEYANVRISDLSITNPRIEDLEISGIKAANFNSRFMKDTPFELVKATIQKITLDVPISKLFSDQITVKIDVENALIQLRIKEKMTFEEFKQQQKSSEMNLNKNNQATNNQKQTSFYDNLFKNIIQRMHIRCNGIVILILTNDAIKDTNYNIGFLLKVSKIEKRFQEQSQQILFPSLERSGFLEKSGCLEQSINFSERQIQQTIEVEVSQLTLHIMNKINLEKPEYQNVNPNLKYPFQWPLPNHPSTVLFLENAYAKIQTSQFKNIHQERIDQDFEIDLFRGVQVQLEPYQLKLLLRLIKPFQNWNIVKQKHQSKYEKVQQGIHEDLIKSVSCISNVEDPSMIGTTMSFSEFEKFCQKNQSMDDQQLLQSVIDQQFNQMEMEEQLKEQGKQFIGKKEEDQFPLQYSKKMMIKFQMLMATLYLESPQQQDGSGNLIELERSWQSFNLQTRKNRKAEKQPINQYILKLNGNDFFIKIRNGALREFVSTISKVKFQKYSFKQIKSGLVDSSAFQSAQWDQERNFTPSFNENIRRYGQGWILNKLDLQNYQQFKENLIFIGSDFSPKNSKGILEILNVQNQKPLRQAEMIDFFNLQNLGQGFHKTDYYQKLKQQNNNNINNVQKTPSVFKVTFSQHPGKNLNISIPKLLVSFSLELLADLNVILNPFDKFESFQNMIQPIEQIKKPPIITPSDVEEILTNSNITINQTRIVMNTWKLGKQMENYQFFTNKDAVMMNNSTQEHKKGFPDPSVMESFGIMLELNQLKTHHQSQNFLDSESNFQSLDLFMYQLKDPQQQVHFYKLLNINPNFTDSQNISLKFPQLTLKEERKGHEQKIQQNFDSKESMSIHDDGLNTIQQTFFTQKRFEKINQQYETYIQNKVSNLQIHLNAPLLLAELDIQVLETLNLFINILQIQLERQDQARTFLSENLMLIEKEKPIINPIVVWINELKDNISIKLQCDQIHAKLKCGQSKDHVPDLFNQSVSQVKQWKVIFHSDETQKDDYNISLLMFETSISTFINMSRIQRNNIKRDEIFNQLSIQSNEIVLIDPNQQELHRQSIFTRWQRPQIQTQFEVIEINSAILPSYYQHHILIHSIGISPIILLKKRPNQQQSVQNLIFQNHKPCFEFKFHFNKSEDTNKNTLEKQITKNMDIRQLSLKNISVRIGDGQLKFLKLLMQKPQNDPIKEEQEFESKKSLLQRLENRRTQFNSYQNYLLQNLYIQDLSLDSISISLPLIYTSNDIINNQKFQQKVVQCVLDQNKTAQISSREFNQQTENDIFVGHSQFVVTLKNSKFSMINQKLIQFKKPDNEVLNLELSLKQLRLNHLVDSLVYRDTIDCSQWNKSDYFPFLIRQKPFIESENEGFQKNITTSLSESYLEYLGFQEILSVDDVQLTLCTQNQFNKKDISINLGVNTIKFVLHMKDLEDLIIHLKMILSFVDKLKEEQKDDQQDNQQKSAFVLIHNPLENLMNNFKEKFQSSSEDGEFVIVQDESLRWNKYKPFDIMKNTWEGNENLRISHFSINIQSMLGYIKEGSCFKFMNQFNQRKQSNSSYEEKKDQAPLMEAYLNQTQFQQKVLKTLRQKQPIQIGQRYKELSINITQINYVFDNIAFMQQLPQNVLKNISHVQFDLKDLDIRLIKDVTTGDFAQILSNQSDELFVFFQTLFGEKDYIDSPCINIILSPKIQITIQNSLISFLLDLKELIQLKNSDKLIEQQLKDQSESCKKLYDQIKLVTERISNPEIIRAKKEKAKLPWKLDNLHISNFSLIVSLIAENLNYQIDYRQLLNLKTIRGLNIGMIEISLQNERLNDETFKKIGDIYKSDIKSNIAQTLRQIPILGGVITVINGVTYVIINLFFILNQILSPLCYLIQIIFDLFRGN